MSDKDLDIYGSDEIEVTPSTTKHNNNGRDSNEQGNEGGEQEQQTKEEENQEQQQEEETFPICVILADGDYFGLFGEVVGELDEIYDIVKNITNSDTLYLSKEDYAVVDDTVDYTYFKNGEYEVAYGNIYSLPKKEDVLNGVNKVTILNDQEGKIIIEAKNIFGKHKFKENAICVILKNGQFKGLFGEILSDDNLFAEVSVLTTKAKVLLDKEEFVIVGDIVDYKHSDDNLNEKVLYGELSNMPTKKEILIGFGKVTIINNAEGFKHNASSFNIIRKHKDGEMPELPEEKTTCNVCNFVWELKMASWRFERYVVGYEAYIALVDMYAQCEFNDKDSVWYFKNESIGNYGNSLIELDEKLLKAYILALKNNPIYFKEDGYKYLFFDKIGVFLRSLISDNKICMLGDIGLAPISENEIMLFNGFKILVEENRVDLICKDLNLSINYLDNISKLVKLENIIYSDINNEKVQQLFIKPLIGFVNLLK